MASDLGIVVVEAAGNGSMNLDSDRYLGLFQRSLRDSGAILVGAGDSTQHAPLCWTNFGFRLDLQAWGEEVMTTGYGDLFGDETSRYYTSNFQGTSSASALIAAAVTVLQGVYKSKTGDVLSPQELREILIVSGTPEVPGEMEKHIGPFPDLRRSILALEAKAATPPANADGTALPRTTSQEKDFLKSPFIVFLFSAILVIVLLGWRLLLHRALSSSKKQR